MSVQDAIFVLKTVVDTATTIAENRRDYSKLARLLYDVKNLKYDTELRLNELEKSPSAKEPTEEDEEEEQVSEESKSGSRITLDKVTLTLAEVGLFMDATKSRYPQEKPRVTIAVADDAEPTDEAVQSTTGAGAGAGGGNKRLSRRLFGGDVVAQAPPRRRGYPPALTANFSVAEEELVDLGADGAEIPDAPLDLTEEDLMTTLSKTANSAVEVTAAGAGAAGAGVLSVVNAASDKMAIAKYLSALEEERKNTLGVMTACEAMEAQRKILLAVQNVQEKVASPRGAAGGTGGSPLDLLLSAVTVTVPGTSPNLRNRGVKGWAANRYAGLMGKDKDPFPRGERFMDGIYDPIFETHTVDGIPAYRKRTDPKVWLVLNRLYSRWQIQDGSDTALNARSACYAYCEQSYSQPERCGGHMWHVLNREGGYDEWPDVAVGVTHSLAQLEVIDKNDRVSRLLASNKKMGTVEEALAALALVTYSEENMNNAALVVKACNCLADVIRAPPAGAAAAAAVARPTAASLRATAAALGQATVPADPDVAANVPRNDASATMSARGLGFSAKDLSSGGNGAGVAPVPVPVVPLLAHLLTRHLDTPLPVAAVCKALRYLCRYGGSSAQTTCTIVATVEALAPLPAFLSTLVKALNKHQPHLVVVEPVVWCLSIFAAARPITLRRLNVVEVVIFNTADAYEPTVDHVGNSPDAAAAVCHCVATMLHRLGPRAAKEYFDSDGVAVTVRILQKHRTVLSVVANGCHALAAALACLGPEVADECVNENAPFLMLQLVKELFVEPVAVYWATAALGQMTRHDALRVALAQTKGALSLLVRASEAYRAHPSVGPRLREIYDNFAAADAAGTAATTGRPALGQYVPGGMGNHYLGYWDVAMGGVSPPTPANDGATTAVSGGMQQLALTNVPPPPPSHAAMAAAFSPAGAMAQYMGMGALFDAAQPASSPPTDAAADGTALSVRPTTAAAAAGAASGNPAVAVYPSAGALGELEDYGEGGVDDGPPGTVAALNMAAAPGGAFNQLQQMMPQMPQQQLYQLPMAAALTPAPQNPYPYGQ